MKITISVCENRRKLEEYLEQDGVINNPLVREMVERLSDDEAWDILNLYDLLDDEEWKKGEYYD